MSDPADSAKNFLKRWSRRKRAAEAHAPEAAEPPNRERIVTDATKPPRAAAQGNAAPPAFDPTSLPPIESISATSDISAFLAPGVPDELTRAALRRVWTTDPAIRDFIGLAENQGDFTKPDGVPGFGSLELTPELRRMVAGLFGDAPVQTAPQRHAGAASDEQFAEMPEKTAAPILQPPAPSDDKVDRAEHSPIDHLVTSEQADPDSVRITSQGNNDAATQKNISDHASPRLARRKQGGAVPK